jgi:hypothetical protein
VVKVCRKKPVLEEARGAIFEKKSMFNKAAVMSDKGRSAMLADSAAKRYGSPINQDSIQFKFK